MFHRSICALVTPFRDGAVDFPALRTLVEHQIAAGTDGLVPVGTTGESPTLTHDEHKRVVEAVVDVTAGRIPVIAGAGSNNTIHAIEFAAHAKTVGADAALVVTPYYNKPDQDGLYAHYMAVADAVQLPVFIYNIPGRSVVDMTPATMGRLAEHPNIIGVKDATADLARVDRQREACGADFIQLSGDDSTALAFIAAGGAGCISVTANAAPGPMAAMCAAAQAGRMDDARQINAGLAPLHRALFAAPSPGPVKHVLSLLGLCEADVRLPLVAPSAAVHAKLAHAITHAGLVPADVAAVSDG